MPNDHDTPDYSALRRKLLMAMAALPMAGLAPRLALAAAPATTAVNTTGLAVTDDTVTVGILHSVTGTMAISETGSVEAEKLAIEQINAAGGVLGRKIKFIQEDGASDWPTFAEKAQKLLVNGQMCRGVRLLDLGLAQSRAAGLRAVQRHALLPDLLRGPRAVEECHSTPARKRRSRSSPASTGSTRTKNAKTFYLLGSDYIWPRTSNKIARKHIENVPARRKVVGEEYFPLGNTQFNSVINKIKLQKPDVIYAIIVGGSTSPSTSSSRRPASTCQKQTLLTISVTEDEILGIGGENIAGAYACMKYFQIAEESEQREVRPGLQEDVGRKDA